MRTGAILIACAAAFSPGASAQSVEGPGSMEIERGTIELREGMIREVATVRNEAALLMSGGALVGAEMYSHRGKDHFGVGAATFGRSRFVMSAGSVGRNIASHEFSSMSIEGGEVRHAAFVYDESSLGVVRGAVLGGVFCYDNSRFTMSGGLTRFIVEAADSSVVDISGGRVDGYVSLRDNARLLLSGGVIDVLIFAVDRASVTVEAVAFRYDHDHDPETPTVSIPVGIGDGRVIDAESPLFSMSDLCQSLHGLEVEWAGGATTSFVFISSRRETDAWTGSIVLKAVAQTPPTDSPTARPASSALPNESGMPLSIPGS